MDHNNKGRRTRQTGISKADREVATKHSSKANNKKKNENENLFKLSQDKVQWKSRDHEVDQEWRRLGRDRATCSSDSKSVKTLQRFSMWTQFGPRRFQLIKILRSTERKAGFVMMSSESGEVIYIKSGEVDLWPVFCSVSGVNVCLRRADSQRPWPPHGILQVNASWV